MPAREEWWKSNRKRVGWDNIVPCYDRCPHVGQINLLYWQSMCHRAQQQPLHISSIINVPAMASYAICITDTYPHTNTHTHTDTCGVTEANMDMAFIGWSICFTLFGRWKGDQYLCIRHERLIIQHKWCCCTRGSVGKSHYILHRRLNNRSSSTFW